ncbi:MAG: LysE family transporter [Pseudomonadota bacterium]|nr:LysE family transporter [Pseudomonadota bacterium]
MSVLNAGLTLGFGLIISMGPQNLFLIRQGLKKEHPYFVALICALCDTALILLSTFGVNKLIVAYPIAKTIMTVLGALFLLAYGAKSIYSGIKQWQSPSVMNLLKASKNFSWTRLLLMTVSFSLLNPQAIVDTMIMIGGAVSQYPEEEQLLFVAGVISASFIWFAGIATLSSSCARYLNTSTFWSMLEITSGIIMSCFSVVLLTQ